MTTLTKRLILLAAILVIAAIGWFMLGESDSATARESPAVVAVPASSEAGDGGKVLARVNGAEITAAAVEEALAGQLLKLKRDRHAMIENAVESQVRDRLIGAEAEQRGMSKEELVEAEVRAKVAEVPGAQVDAFYEARKQQIRAPKEQVEEQIRRILSYEGYIEGLKSTAEIEILTEPFRVEVAATGPSKGPDAAPVTIVEFSDFECPYCGRVNPAIEKVLDTYGDKVRIVFRQFPLDIHPNARKAGEASLCAGEQDRFWQMHDVMFSDQKNLAVDGLKALAAGIGGLDASAFNACLDSGRFAETVEEDLKAGARAGVSSTPAFFINGRHLSGAQPYENFVEAIDDELKRVGKSS